MNTNQRKLVCNNAWVAKGGWTYDGPDPFYDDDVDTVSTSETDPSPWGDQTQEQEDAYWEQYEQEEEAEHDEFWGLPQLFHVATPVYEEVLTPTGIQLVEVGVSNMEDNDIQESPPASPHRKPNNFNEL
jgi:hypothetical protein